MSDTASTTKTTTRTDRAARIRSNCIEIQEEARNGNVTEIKNVVHMIDALAGEVAKLAQVAERSARLQWEGNSDA